MQDKRIPRERLERVLEVLKHAGSPHRLEVLVALHEAPGSLSPSKFVGDRDDVTIGQMAYHFRKLADAGLISKTATVQRRGATENLYDLTAKGRVLARTLEELL